MYYDYRVVQFTDDRLAICEVHYDDDRNPVHCENPIELLGTDVQALNSLLVYANRALTEPVLAVSIFTETTSQASKTQTVLDMLRGKK